MSWFVSGRARLGRCIEEVPRTRQGGTRLGWQIAESTGPNGMRTSNLRPWASQW